MVEEHVALHRPANVQPLLQTVRPCHCQQGHLQGLIGSARLTQLPNPQSGWDGSCLDVTPPSRVVLEMADAREMAANQIKTPRG